MRCWWTEIHQLFYFRVRALLDWNHAIKQLSVFILGYRLYLLAIIVFYTKCNYVWLSFFVFPLCPLNVSAKHYKAHGYVGTPSANVFYREILQKALVGFGGETRRNNLVTTSVTVTESDSYILQVRQVQMWKNQGFSGINKAASQFCRQLVFCNQSPRNHSRLKLGK